MDNDFTYHEQRMTLLSSTLEWMIDNQQIGLTVQELSERLELGIWEVQHLFQEYLGRDSSQFLNAAFSPSLFHVAPPAQLSVFDLFEEEKRQRTTAPIELKMEQGDVERIYYTRFPYFLGEVFIAHSEQGICQVTFEDTDAGLVRLKKAYKDAELLEEQTSVHLHAFQVLHGFFTGTSAVLEPLKLAVKGTDFQLQVWKELTQIPIGILLNYGDIANALGDVNASRAVGTAIGANPVALLIPCHRVVNRSGKLGHFRWGSRRKHLLLAIEK